MSWSREWRAAVAVIIATGVVRVAVAAATPLFPDEAYYWEWSRHLAAGYFDHPPLVAWVIRAGTLVAGNTPLGVRLGAVLAGIIMSLLVCATARRLVDDRAALVVALIVAVIPLSGAGLVLATPDATLLAATSAAMYAIVRAVEAPNRSRASLLWWSLAGLAVGLGLSTKYTAVLLPLGVFVALLARRDLRVRLTEPGPYVGIAIALLVFLPVVVWNARRDWISFAFQLQHGLGGVAGSALGRELELIVSQLAIGSPVLFVMIVVVVAVQLRDRIPIRSMLSVIAIVAFGFFMYSATRRRVEANWPAIAYIPGVLLLATHPRTRNWERWLRGGMIVAAVLTAATYVNAFVPILPLPASRDPGARSAGFKDLARAVDRIYSTRLPLSSRRTFVAANRYQDASELAFYLPAQPETFSLNLDNRPNQYDLWPTFPQRARSRDGLILVLDEVESTHPIATTLAPHFETLQQDTLVSLGRNGQVAKRMRIWVLDGWRGTWP